MTVDESHGDIIQSLARDIKRVIKATWRNCKVKLKTLIMTLAATLVCSGAFAQVPGATPDTVKLALLNGVDTTGAEDIFAVQILVSLDSMLNGGTLGFSWDDTINWQYDSTVFGASLLAWPLHNATGATLANSMGAVLIGGADFGGAPFPAGPDQVWATMWFSEKVGSGWQAGNQMLIDSAFVSPGGDFLLTYNGSGTQVAPHFAGAALLSFPTDVQVISNGSLLPKAFALSQNYPNPFNPSTKIGFDVPKKAHVTLAIYNVLGQQVRTLINEELDANSYSVIWEGDNDSGVKVASGMYFYKLVSADFVKSRKMMLVK